jgi:DNA-binding transcriptional ArsR family regulator
MSLDAVYKAMADPTRRQILELLRERPLTAGEVADRFELGKPTISHHLAKLAEADLVYGERVGTTITYHLNLTVFEELVTTLVALFQGKAASVPPIPPTLPSPAGGEGFGSRSAIQADDLHGGGP